MASDPRVGTVVAGYRIESLIGRGGMSVVYLAHHEGLERKAALKLLAPELAENQAFRQRFVRESRIAAGLDHPNVIPVYDAGEADGLLFIAMRYVRGSDLKTLLAELGPLDPSDVVWVMDQLGAALDAAHAEGLVHRDVKPANVLLSPAAPPAKVGHLYLADFGLTKKSLSGSGITRSGQFVGTIDYVAPEQIRSEPVDGRTDVYSLGCLLYECCTGEPPFVRDTEVAVMFAHLNDPPPKPTDTHAELPRAVDDVVAKAMAKVPSDRYASAGELAGAAMRALGPTPASAPEVGPASSAPTQRTRRRRTVWVGGIGVALVVAVAVIVALVAKNGGEPPVAATSPAGTHAATPTASAPPTSAGITVPAGFQGVAKLEAKAGTVGGAFPLEFNRAAGGEGTLSPRPILAAEGAVWVSGVAGGRFSSATDIVKVDPDTGSKEDVIRLRNNGVQSMSFAAGQSSLWALTYAGIVGVGDDDLYRLDPATDQVVATIPIGQQGVGVAAGSEGVWVVTAGGKLQEIDTGSNSVARTISGIPAATAIAVTDRFIWIADAVGGVVYRVDPRSEKVETIRLPAGADGIAADSTGVWVMDRASGTVVRIDPGTGDVGQQIQVGAEPASIAVGAGSVWVSDQTEGAVWRIDPGSLEAESIHVGGDPGPGGVSVGESGVWTTLA